MLKHGSTFVIQGTIGPTRLAGHDTPLRRCRKSVGDSWRRRARLKNGEGEAARQPRSFPQGRPACTSTTSCTSLFLDSGHTRYCRMSGLSVQHSFAAGPYGVRGSDPNRLHGLEALRSALVFPTQPSMTFCPYVVCRPHRTDRGYPQITRSSAGSAEPRYSSPGSQLPGSNLASLPFPVVILPPPSPPACGRSPPSPTAPR